MVMHNRSPARHGFQRLVPHPAVGKSSESGNLPLYHSARGALHEHVEDLQMPENISDLLLR
jgi:hypothetical protein